MVSRAIRRPADYRHPRDRATQQHSDDDGENNFCVGSVFVRLAVSVLGGRAASGTGDSRNTAVADES